MTIHSIQRETNLQKQRIADGWELFHDGSSESTLEENLLKIKECPSQYAYLAQGPILKLPLGKWRVTYDLHISEGGLTVGFIENGGGWIVYQNHKKSTKGEIELNLLTSREKVRLMIAACNNGDGLPVNAELRSLIFEHIESGLKARLHIVLEKGMELWRKLFRANLLPKVYLTRLKVSCMRGRMAMKFGSLGLHIRTSKRYRVIDEAAGGYAVRGLSLIQKKSRRYLLTADVGDDTVSLFKIDGFRLLQRRTMRFPVRSTPIHLGEISANGLETSKSFACLFNFGGGDRKQTSYLVELTDVERLLATTEVIDPERDTNVLLKSRGICGYRGVDTWCDKKNGYIIASVNRDANTFHLLRGSISEDPLVPEYNESLYLGESAEPIGIGRCSFASDPHSPIYFLSLRGRAEIIAVKCPREKKPFISQAVSVAGLSRSSVAVGRFTPSDKMQLALAIWGGDPKDLNSRVRGKLCIADLDADGTIDVINYYTGGVHPTDVVAGDFDGDGVDEIALLNYGSGLGPTDRNDLGGVDIFKWRNNALQKASTIKIANPRIGAAMDIDGDGVDELVISMFFEKRMVVIKAL